MRTSVPRRRFIPAAQLSILLLGGCASGGGGSGESSFPESDADIITLEELEPYSDWDALRLVETVRPRWLRVRRTRTFVSETGISVIVDDIPRGGIGRLGEIRVIEVRELRYLSASDATTRFGVNMAGGAILVYRKR
jgi:hypothetical protein